MTSSSRRAIGIDLGTTNSLVAWVTDGHAELGTDDTGTSLVPSVVFYADDGRALVFRPAVEKDPCTTRKTAISSNWVLSLRAIKSTAF